MKITDALLGEHAVFYAQFDHLEDTASLSELRDTHQRAALLAAALASHAQIENDLLFDAMGEVMGRGAGPVAVMLAEHREIENTLERIARETSAETARNLLIQVIDTARSHFAKEEQVAFPMAEGALGGETLERLGEAWAERRGVIVP